MRSQSERKGRAVLAVMAVVLALWPSARAAAAPAASAAGSPLGNLEPPSARNPDPHVAYSYVLYGWAFDPDAPGQPTTLSVYVNGTYTGDIKTGQPRPDVQAVYPSAGPNAGYTLGVGPDPQSGAPKTVCVYAINAGPGENTTLGCTTVPTTNADGREPMGSLDEVRVSPGLVHIRGWTTDRDEPGTDVDLRVIEDFGPMFAVKANLPRPDVPLVYPGLDGTTGFDQDLPARPGHHQICAFAGNLGAGGGFNTPLCASVDVPGPTPAGPNDPQGNQEQREDVFENTGYTDTYIEGWAFDPDTSGPWTVRILTGIGTCCTNEYTHPVEEFLGTTSEPRPDVQAAYPAAGPNAGYKIRTNAGAWAGINLACVYVRQEGSGLPERFIGCT